MTDIRVVETENEKVKAYRLEMREEEEFDRKVGERIAE